MDILQAENIKVLRATVLGLVYDNHTRQQSRLTMVGLGGALDRLHFDCPLNHLATVLQDLKERGCLDFESTKDRYTGRISIGKIRILPYGRDLVEGTKKDEAIQFD